MGWAEALQGAGAWMSGNGPQYMNAQSIAEEGRARQEELRLKSFITEGLMAESMIRNGRPDQALQLFESRVESGKKLPPIQGLGGNFDASANIRDMLRAGDVNGALTQLSTANKIFRDAGMIGGDTNPQQFGATFMAKDQAGNLFQGTQVRDPNTGQVQTAMSPVGHNSPQQGQLAMVGQMGMTQGDAVNYAGDRAAAQQAAQLSYAGPIAGAEAGAKAAVEAETAPQIAAATTTATSQAEAQAALRARQVKAQQIYTPFGTQLIAIRDAFNGTGTGPFVGRFAGLTSSSQKAQAAAKIMEPLLKGVVRDAGEGTFTEGDRAQIVDMMPKETDKPDVVTYKVELLDKFVRGKLGVPDETPSPIVDWNDL